MAYYYHYQHLRRKKLISSLAVAAALFLAALVLAMSSLGNTYADHRPGAEVSHEAGACGETTFTASAIDTSVTNMYLVVSANGDTQYEKIATAGDTEVTTGPFTEDTTIYWHVFGGGERDYDDPHWNGYGDPGFGAAVGDYATEVGGFSWVLAGPEDPNPFTTWNTVDVTGCERVVTHSFNGGGHLLTEDGKRKNWKDISFGGDVLNYDVGGPEGDLTVQFHNVLGDDMDKTSFHATEITEFNYFDGDSESCHSAVNFTAMGMWNGNPGYKLILRAGDNGSPNNEDTVRVSLFDDTDTIMYDTSVSDFSGGSDCVGTARTDLDKGNLTIKDLTE